MTCINGFETLQLVGPETKITGAPKLAALMAIKTHLPDE
jgi:hypothetical protein